VYLAEGGVIRLNDLPGEMRVAEISKDTPAFDRIEPLEEMEKRYIAYVLKKFDGNKKKAADALGINRKTIHRKLEET
jgi:DNA-binding NtrC family response regulator